MGTLTLVSWKNTVAFGLVQSLPLQDFESALVLTESYLSSIGGWVPDDPADPTGVGEPANGETPEEAIASITTFQYSRIYTVSLNVDSDLKMSVVANLAPGLDDSSVLGSIENTVTDVINAQLTDTALELEDVTTFTGTVISGGEISATDRSNIQTTIAAGGKLIDPPVIALVATRTRYNLDTTWNISNIYTEPDEPLVFITKKYTDTSYTTLDAETTSYTLKLDSKKYTVISGLKLTS